MQYCKVNHGNDIASNLNLEFCLNYFKMLVLLQGIVEE